MNELQVIGFSELTQMANTMAKSGMFGKTPEQMLSLMMIAQAESLHPALAAMEYDIIQGRPALKGQAALARFQQAGGKIEWIVKTDAQAKAKFSHPQGGELTVDWPISRAVKMGLDGKDNWKKQPGTMLSWRCVAEGVRMVFPACLNRMYLAEEVQDFEPMKNVTPAREPEECVKLAVIPEIQSTQEIAIDWVKKAAELTAKAGLDKDMKKSLFDDCGKDVKAYCEKVEAILNFVPDATIQENSVPEINIADLNIDLEQFLSSDATPAAAKKDIQDAFARNESDPVKLLALLEKVKSASGK